MNRIFKDFLDSKEELREFYSWLPDDGIEKINEIVSIFSKQDKKSIPLIITGQQPIVFGGPLYIIYKIATVLKLSSYLNKCGNETRSMFWVHSWDHDWKEVCTINFLSFDYEIIAFSFLPEINERGRPLYKISLDKAYFYKKTQDIFNRIRGSEFSASWKEFILNSISESINLSDWTVSILKQFFKYENLTMFEPHKTTNTQVLQQLIEVAIDNHPLLFSEFNKTTQNLIKIGYKPQVHKLPQSAFFFLEENGYRSKLNFDKGLFYSEVSQKEYTISEMKSILREEPERFSPNLLLRCVYQQMMFPCVIYVGGPSEVSYWAQLKDLFSLFKLSLPVVFPRNRFIVLPLKINKWLNELDIDVYDLPNMYSRLENLNLFSLSNSKKQEIEQSKDKLLNSASQFFESLYGMFNENSLENYRNIYLTKIEKETKKLIDIFIKTHGSKSETTQKRLRHILNVIFPNKTEQERFYSPFSFILEYDYDFIRTIINKININNYDVDIIEL